MTSAASKSLMNRPVGQAVLRASASLAAVLLLAACASVTPVATPPVPPLAGLPRYDIESVDPLELSTEMKQFVAEYVGRRSAVDDRAWSLSWALLDPNVLDFEYDPQVTLTAAEAFRTRRGNCLTFSNMFVAMAREAGLNAWYREVEIDPEWNALDDTLLVSLHVNAATIDRGREYVIDVSRRPAREGERYRKISDREAEAQFYNNLGANALVADELPMAYAYFRKAEQTNPGLDYVWSNLGVVYRRNGQTEDAILAYETALALNERNTVPLNNLYSIYDEDGEIEKAATIQQRVERNRSRNPYYLHYLAESAFAEHALDEAIDYANRAIRIEDREYRFYYTLAQLQYRTGRESRARLNLKKAIRLAPDWVDQGSLVLPGKVPERETEDG
jgi:Flp pilus assembly protein TadD